jgi:hypothetical protein
VVGALCVCMCVCVCAMRCVMRSVKPWHVVRRQCTKTCVYFAAWCVLYACALRCFLLKDFKALACIKEATLNRAVVSDYGCSFFVSRLHINSIVAYVLSKLLEWHARQLQRHVCRV